jgi:hypothetical protein
VTGNVTASSQVQGGVVNATTSFNIGGTPFAFGSYGGQNAFLGYAGNATTTGFQNTASGRSALSANTTGSYNAANGVRALTANTTGNGNTASGFNALVLNTTGQRNTASEIGALTYNTTGSYNTALGSLAGPDSTQPNLINATAIGAYADVAESNALVLDSISGVNGATASTNVGIGTTTPQYELDVHGTGNFTGPVTLLGRPSPARSRW